MVSAVLAQRPGFEGPTTTEFIWPCVTPDLFGIGGFCVNRVVLLTFLAAVVTLLFFVLLFRNLRLVPGKAQSIGELGIEFVRNQVIMAVAGPQALRYLPYLTTVFFFIFFSNLLGIIPFVNYAPTSSTAIPGLLAIFTWVIFNYAGIKQHGGLGYLRKTLFPPGVPAAAYLFLTPIEFISTFLVRPLTLTLRLAANMIAGHMALLVFLLGTEYMLEPIFHGELSITELWAVGSYAIAIALTGFEMAVAGIQAFIFVILTASYIETALTEEH